MWRTVKEPYEGCSSFVLFMGEDIWGTFTTEEHAKRVGGVLATRNDDVWVGIEDDKSNLLFEWEDA